MSKSDTSSKSVAPKIKKDLGLRVSGQPHTSTDAEKSPQPQPKGDYLHTDGSVAHDKSTRKNLPGVRQGNTASQK